MLLYLESYGMAAGEVLNLDDASLDDGVAGGWSEPTTPDMHVTIRPVS